MVSVRRLLLSVSLSFSFSLGLAGCSASSKKPAAVEQTFPPYSGEATRLFDDGIDPIAVGLADVASKPRTDPVLRARTQRAEAVGRLRVSTVTAESIGGKPTYRVNLVFLEAAALRSTLPTKSVEIYVRPNSPSFGIIKFLDTRLIGRTFIGFFHRFDGGDETSLKFHLSADDEDVRAAVRDAIALREVSSK